MESILIESQFSDRGYLDETKMLAALIYVIPRKEVYPTHIRFLHTSQESLQHEYLKMFPLARLRVIGL